MLVARTWQKDSQDETATVEPSFRASWHALVLQLAETHNPGCEVTEQGGLFDHDWNVVAMQTDVDSSSKTEAHLEHSNRVCCSKDSCEREAVREGEDVGEQRE